MSPVLINHPQVPVPTRVQAAVVGEAQGLAVEEGGLAEGLLPQGEHLPLVKLHPLLLHSLQPQLLRAHTAGGVQYCITDMGPLCSGTL